jgi:two-component system, OmpR family, response regulator RstA
MTTSKDRILIVDDDIKLLRLVSEYLESNGFHITTETQGDKAVDRILQEIPDLVILDLMLPGLDGLSVCQKVRTQYKHPILMLTAKGEEGDELVGLEIGADDYMAKPVSPQLLLARIKTLLRRSQRFESTRQHLTFGPVEIDCAKRTVHISSRPIDITTTEFELLWFLVKHAGEVVTRDQISHALRGHEWDGLERSIDLTVSRLRKKLGDDGRNPEWIHSIRSSGYMWTLSE